MRRRWEHAGRLRLATEHPRRSPDPPPAGVLERGLKELEPGEHWAVTPGRMQHNPHLWSPGVKRGIQASGFIHATELFGAVLGVMRACDLDETIGLVNQTGWLKLQDRKPGRTRATDLERAHPGRASRPGGEITTDEVTRAAGTAILTDL